MFFLCRFTFVFRKADLGSCFVCFCLASGFQYRGEGIRNVFEIRVFENLAIQPSVEQLDICREDDLFLMADFYQIKFPHGAVKK